jgi:hypothetical protein
MLPQPLAAVTVPGKLCCKFDRSPCTAQGPFSSKLSEIDMELVKVVPTTQNKPSELFVKTVTQYRRNASKNEMTGSSNQPPLRPAYFYASTVGIPLQPVFIMRIKNRPNSDYGIIVTLKCINGRPYFPIIPCRLLKSMID